MENKKGRTFCAILYPNENKEHKRILEYISKNYDCAYINHNKDITEDGEVKKEHTHIIWRAGSNPRWKSAIVEELKIEEHLLDPCNKEKMLRYLIHYDQENKHRYSVEEVKGSWKKELKKIIKKEESSTEQNMLQIIEYIYKNKKTTYNQVIIWAIEQGIYETIRNNQYIIIKIIEERNNNGYKRNKFEKNKSRK